MLALFEQYQNQEQEENRSNGSSCRWRPTALFCPIFLLIALFTLFSALPMASGQALNDPSQQYIEGRMAGRRIWWCPSGYGYLAYCPQPTDWDNYNWCCTFPYLGSWKPSCCPFAIPTGTVITVIIASIVLVAVLIGMSCWCCYFCPLYKQLYESEEDEEYEGGGRAFPSPQQQFEEGQQ